MKVCLLEAEAPKRLCDAVDSPLRAIDVLTPRAVQALFGDGIQFPVTSEPKPGARQLDKPLPPP